MGVPAADRIALLSIWFHGHNNPRYAELLPRLDRLDACLLRLPDSRIPRGLGFRAFSATKPLLLTRRARPCATSRYPNLLTLDFDQLPRWHGAAVMDADDPIFSPREIELLQSPAVRAYVVTAETAARRYESLGVSKAVDRHPAGREPRRRHPRAASGGCGPQAGGRGGARLDGGASADGRRHAAPTTRSTTSTTCSSSGTRSASACRTPGSGSSAGRASGCRRVSRAATTSLLLGRLPRDQALATAAAFDVAPYARTADQGIRAAKVSEFIGLGVPTVSYDYEVTANLRETGAGVLVPDARAFVDAAATLLEDEAARGRLAAAATRAGRELDWDVLARRYADEVLDRYLPKSDT